jgi:hypothetical protein
MWGEYERVRDLVEVGAYRKGADARVDRAIAVYPKLLDFMRQDIGKAFGRAESLASLRLALGEPAAEAVPSSQFPVPSKAGEPKGIPDVPPGTRNLELGTRNSPAVPPGTRNSELGTRNSPPGVTRA